jgi:hypothetical protein
LYNAEDVPNKRHNDFSNMPKAALPKDLTNFGQNLGKDYMSLKTPMFCCAIFRQVGSSKD